MTKVTGRGMGVLVGLLLVVFLSAPAAYAQVATATTGAISGVVVDPTGAVVVGAKVRIEDEHKTIVRETETDSSGRYVFPGVPPETYTLTVSMEGFKQAAVRNLVVAVATTRNVPVTLEVGAVAQTVEVTAGAGVELQTTDATVGNVIDEDRLIGLPNPSRAASALLDLQPGTVPRVNVGFGDQGGATTGARSDQTTWLLDGIDVTDNIIAGGGAIEPAVQIPAESVSEFRVSVTNPNATYGRAAGAQIALTTKSGSNEWHGSAYWYHQNDNLNANSWDRNRLGQEKPELKDNRFGFTTGGPMWKDKAFFHFNYEGRRFPRSASFSRIVPTDTLRQGILRFTDGAGNIVSYDLATSTLCGAAGGVACDPRGLGLNSIVQSTWASMPDGNDTSVGGTDGLNTTGFTDVTDTSLESDFITARFDQNFGKNWRAQEVYTWEKSVNQALGGAPCTAPMDIRGGLGNSIALCTIPAQPRRLVAGLIGQITPRLTNEFRFGYTRQYWALDRPLPTAGAVFPGSNIHLSIAGAGTASLLDQPVDVDVQRARFQSAYEHTWQFVDSLTWVKGKHTIQGGTTIRRINLVHPRSDKVIGAYNVIIGFLESGSFFQVPTNSRPPTCVGAQTNCLISGQEGRWNDLYAATLGILDNVQVMAVRDAELNNLPLGSLLVADSTNMSYEFFANDTWRISPGFTLSYGLMYQWQTPPVEKQGRQTYMINNEGCDPSNLPSCEILTAPGYIEAKREAALNGTIFNPEIGFVPVRSGGRKTTFDTDKSNWGPSIAASWSPSFTSGFAGTLFGDRKTVFRGGYRILYDRMNTVQTVVIPMLGVGFAQTVSVLAPQCDINGTPGTGCNTAGSASESAFRVGEDGDSPLPTVPTVTPPVVPTIPFGEILSFQVDPEFKIGRNHSIDFTIQRELPWNMIFEIGWAGRWGRNLNQSVNFNSIPYFQVDPASGQTFAEAFDAVAEALRAGDPVVDQPWFENALNASDPIWGLIGVSPTQFLALSFTSDFVNGNVWNLWAIGVDLVGRLSLTGQQPFNNLQSLDLFVRTDGGISNYHGLIVILRKRLSHGLTFDFNYTISKSLDQIGTVQNNASYFASAYFPDLEYGVSLFDRTHIMNLNWRYELPFGRGRHFSAGNWADKVIGGWSVSGIVSAFTGLPFQAGHTNQGFGGGAIFSDGTGAIPLRSIPDASAHGGVAGSGGVGISGDPATDGTGLNMFGNPESIFNSFRHILLAQDTRTGRGAFRGMPHWNLDLSIGKRTSVTERVTIAFSFDFFNILNRVEYFDPFGLGNYNTLDLTNPSTFGVISQSWFPINRLDGSRGLQFGFRVEF